MPRFVNEESEKNLDGIKGDFFRVLTMNSLKIKGNLIIPRIKKLSCY